MIVYEFELNTAHSIFMVPKDARAVAVGDKGGAVFVFFLGDQAQGLVPRKVVGYRSEMSVEAGGVYVGTALLKQGAGNYDDGLTPPLAFHIFDYGEVKGAQ